MKIEVTEEDIKKGTTDPCNCPVARAIKRATGYGASVSHTVGIVYSMDETQEDGSSSITTKETYLPRKVEMFINKYDEAKRLAKPFIFLLK